MPPMPSMPGMDSLPRLTWGTFFDTWHVDSWWLVTAVVLGGLYLTGRRLAGETSTVRGWRVGCWLAGLALMWVCAASAIGAYAMSLFWMHMVLHLMLIMLVPALLVLGHPLTVLLESFPADRQDGVRRVLRGFPLSVITHPAFGLLVYTVTIIGTHLTGFMDQMARHDGLMTAEQILYIVAGYLLLLPLLGNEPIRSDPPYLGRIALLVLAMVPDTIVGIVLLQTGHDLFPAMMAMHPSWAPDPVSDIHAAGGLMWAGGDGGMMLIAVGLMISVITSPARRDRMTGAWLDGVRRSTVAGQHGAGTSASEAPIDPDSEEAYEAYNRMLARLSGHEGEQ
jgi:cytochrome c oxidase assembly factor CtaG